MHEERLHSLDSPSCEAFKFHPIQDLSRRRWQFTSRHSCEEVITRQTFVSKERLHPTSLRSGRSLDRPLGGKVNTKDDTRRDNTTLSPVRCHSRNVERPDCRSGHWREDANGTTDYQRRTGGGHNKIQPHLYVIKGKISDSPYLQSTLLPLIAAPPHTLSLRVKAIRMNLPASVFDPPTCGWNFPRVTLSSGHLLFWPSATFAWCVAEKKAADVLLSACSEGTNREEDWKDRRSGLSAYWFNVTIESLKQKYGDGETSLESG